MVKLTKFKLDGTFSGEGIIQHHCPHDNKYFIIQLTEPVKEHKVGDKIRVKEDEITERKQYIQLPKFN